MKKIARQIALLAALLLVICVIQRLATGNRYTAFVPIPQGIQGAQGIRVTADLPGRLQPGEVRRVDTYARVQLKPQQRGEADMRFVSDTGEAVAQREYRITPLMTVYDPMTGGFTGDSAVMLAFTAFCFAVAFLMFRWFLTLRWTEFYAYGTIYAAGFSIFALLTGVLMAYVSARHIADPAAFPMLSAYMEISRASWRFMSMTSPLLLVFALYLAFMLVAGAINGFRHRSDGYYHFGGDTVYYHYGPDWYYTYDDNMAGYWYSADEPPVSSYSDYYAGDDWDSDWGVSDFKESSTWSSIQESHSSSSSDYDSWDSGGTDWDSDW